ncbi:MAG: hypothetical protein RLN70_01890, partial [Rhodospirillaceae bacterium]
MTLRAEKIAAIANRETPQRGVLKVDGQALPCVFGRGGVSIEKTEGDGRTPEGQFPLRGVYYRADRVTRPETALPTVEISPADGWCDAPDDPMYNKPVTLPYAASAERMWRDDHQYDVVVVIGHNDSPAVPNRGSA